MYLHVAPSQVKTPETEALVVKRGDVSHVCELSLSVCLGEEKYSLGFVLFTSVCVWNVTDSTLTWSQDLNYCLSALNSWTI